MLIVRCRNTQRVIGWTPDIDPSEVEQVHLDGDDLDRYIKHFENMPYSSARVMSLFGDAAKTVVANWGSILEIEATEGKHETNG